MLEYLRNMSGKPVAKVLIGVLTFSFVGWGVAEWVFSNAVRESDLFKVGSVGISVEQFNVMRARELSALSREQQKSVYTDPVYANQFYARVMSDMANNIMIETHARDMGFIVTDKKIARDIASYAEFQENGKFSTYRFDFYLNQMNMTESQFADYLRSNILRSMVLGALSMPVNVPEFAVRAAYDARYGQRQIEYRAIDFKDFNVGNPTDDQLREFYAKNPKTNPETRAVSYVLVPAKMEQPDSYDAAYATAQKLEDAIISGESMPTAASKLKAKYVSIPAFAADKKMTDAVMDAQMITRVFSMDAGLESEIVETKQGFVILVVDKINPAHTAEFDSVKKNLVDAWRHDEQKKRAYLVANDLLVDLNAGNGLKNKKTATVSRASGAPTDLLASAFSSVAGENLIVPGANAFYVLRVVAEIPPKIDTKKMADLRTELQNVTARNLMEDYSGYLYRLYPVRVNDKTMNKLMNRN